jgi:hypothetical protein
MRLFRLAASEDEPRVDLPEGICQACGPLQPPFPHLQNSLASCPTCRLARDSRQGRSDQRLPPR